MPSMSVALAAALRTVPMMASTGRTITRVSAGLAGPAAAPEAALRQVLAEIGREAALVQASLIRGAHQPVVSWQADGRQGHHVEDAVLVRLGAEIDTQMPRADEASGAMVVTPRLGPSAALLATISGAVWLAFPLGRRERSLGVLLAAYRPRRWLPMPGRTVLLSVVARLLGESLAREHEAAERKELAQRLQQSQRLEAAGTLASGLAHNLNNIIGAIMGNAELAENALAMGGSPSRPLQEIRRGCERAEALVENLLHLGRRRSFQQDVDLSDLVAESLSMLRASLGARCDITLRDEAPAMRVKGRAGELQQVVLNLVRNAAQAHAETVRLVLADAQLEQVRDCLSGPLASGRYARITVADDGEGMDAAMLERVFEPFFTTRATGTGLGLATVADIVREHDGAIDVTSTPGRGSVFQIWLRATPAHEPVRKGQGEIVMVVADGAREQLLYLEDVVAALGYEPSSFDSHDAALAAEPEHDAAIVDARGAAHDRGLALARAMRGRHPELPLVILADDARAAALAAELQLGRGGDALRIETAAEASRLGTALSRLIR